MHLKHYVALRIIQSARHYVQWHYLCCQWLLVNPESWSRTSSSYCSDHSAAALWSGLVRRRPCLSVPEPWTPNLLCLLVPFLLLLGFLFHAYCDRNSKPPTAIQRGGICQFIQGGILFPVHHWVRPQQDTDCLWQRLSSRP